MTKISFRQFLQTAFQHGAYTTDDVIAAVLPLFKSVQRIHDAGLVAAFDQDALLADNRIVYTDDLLAHAPAEAPERVAVLFSHQNPHFEVVDKVKLQSGDEKAINLQIHKDPREPLRHAAYIPGFNSYEILLGHHDEQTDIFCLGQVLAAVALGLDLYDPGQLDELATQRLHPLQHRTLHPAVGTLITEMTELDRRQRTQDLQEAIHRLENYRDFDPEKQTDLSEVAGWVCKERTERQEFILSKLRNRLFDTSRRNRLLFYKSNARFANLTLSSVPMVLHHQSIRPELLFTWNDVVAEKVTSMQEIPLNKFLRFEDHPYLPAVLNKIRLEARRDVQEYGFSQLKLVVAFLKWHNLPEEPEESILSPLLLIPVELKKKKQAAGDQFVLEVLDNNAEVNPVLANQLRDLYGIALPDMVDLEEMTVEQFHRHLQVQVEGANRGIVLQYMQKPRIRLIYKEARETLQQYHQKLKKEIPAPAAATPDHELFELAEAQQNPYRWEFDTCHVVLGNFNYKKMSLVQDYNAVIDEPQQHPVFEQLFSASPRPVRTETEAASLPDEWFHVIQADPTQTQAITQARNGESYIIQGPPGTGKSQTITNLIADFVARGKQVLFVCEKRAALDVVYHRLKQQGLDELCCYIHDSQSDKRSFIKDLKQTYESFLQPGPDLHSVTVKRNALLHNLGQQLELLQQFHDTHANEQEHAGLGIRSLMERLLALKPQLRPLEAAEEETVPHYKQWLQYGIMVEQLGEALEETGAEPVFAAHPLSKVNEQVFAAEQPISLLQKLIANSTRLLEEIGQTLRTADIQADSISALQQLVRNAVLLQPLAENNNLPLVDPQTPEAQAFAAAIQQLNALHRAGEHAAAQNGGWLQKFSEQDTVQALAIAERHESSFWRFLFGNWRRLKKQVHAQYDFSKHSVAPLCSQLLQSLKAEYDAARLLADTRKQMQLQFRTDNIDFTWLSVSRLRDGLTDPALQYLLQHARAKETVVQLARLHEPVQRLLQSLQQVLQDAPPQAFRPLADLLESIHLNAPALEELLPALDNYLSMPAELKQALRTLPFTPPEMEAGMAHKTLRHFYRHNKTFANTTGQTVEKAVEQIRHCYHTLLQLNAEFIRTQVRRRFSDHVQLTAKAPSQVEPAQQDMVRQYADGRKILENEFAKSMRYKSIRELTSRGSGLVLKDLKPVWLMSPLSVSDSLALDQPFFDAVIFDEASQITLEEGVPALYRAPQTIIVGDDKQMPPTDFFSAKSGDPDDLERDDEEDEILSADADSLLVQGARKMNSYMLGWHYRSHFETLISYSNHAFYDAGLLTIPDRSIHSHPHPAITVKAPSDAMFNAKALQDRSISFHHLPEGVYLKRGNQSEAAYIAHLVRELLLKKTPESIGIVAFSQEQQHAITAALDALAANDKKFEELLEDATERMDEGQFTGLFVKNLENVQGDERDIIIMSVCYAPDYRGKMLMNFGPINKRGGEKRLNVIFSRAKQHMAVVSSIRHHQITNVYNAGANYLRRFLQYAEMVSTGNMGTARNILDSLASGRNTGRPRSGGTVILGEIREQLEQHGFAVSEQVGQSGFKCSLAVKAKADDKAYTLSIIVDDDLYYQHGNVLEQYYQRPAILESFGWKTMTVYAKDWLLQPQRVMEDILKHLGKAADAAPLTSLLPQQEVPEGTTRLLQGEGKNEKFWDVAVSGARLFIRQGKTGTKGQIQVQTCMDAADAEKEKERLVTEKKSIGWREGGAEPKLF